MKSVFTSQSVKKQLEQNEFEKLAQRKRNFLRASKSICGKSVLEPLQKPNNKNAVPVAAPPAMTP